jgi:2-succinyl-6-hydroxy-2,4-cyclohexadiene-1-carboxylate synthase
MPVLLIAGELDTKFCKIAQEMHQPIPGSRLEIIGGAGHTVHLEKPEIFDKIVLDFIQEENLRSPFHAKGRGTGG